MRVSGPDSRSALESLTGQPCPSPRLASLRTLKAQSRTIDTALVLYFQGPASFTGEDMAEFHLHGGRAIVACLSKALETLACRQAEPGEFSRRAFLNGKIDLTEAEAIADLIDAETEAQHAQAMLQAGGALSVLYNGWAERLLQARAHGEATLDFADEDLPPDVMEPVCQEVRNLAGEIDLHLADARRGERLREGVRIAILGAPNAGKSSLINALAQRDVAIVSPRPGTTRDVVEVHLDLGGYPVIVADTAGLRETEDEIEQEGITRARTWAGQADLILMLVDGSTQAVLPDTPGINGTDTLLVITKCDIIPAVSHCDSYFAVAHKISVRTGEGLPELLDTVTTKVRDLIGDLSRPAPTRARHAAHLRETLAACERFLDSSSPDLAAEELRLAASALGRITGRTHAEALLEIIFRDFCIGK